jgi:hypothetical protein
MKLRSLVTIAGIAVSGIAIGGANVPAQAVSTLLTSEVGYTGPGLDLSPYANGSYNYYTSSPQSIPGGITLTSTNIAPPPNSSVLGQGRYGIVGYGGFPGNNFLGGNSVYAGLNSGNDSMTFTFDTPVQEFGAFVNYAPGAGIYYASLSWDKPTISAYNGVTLLASFDLSALAPIATPGNPPGGGSPTYTDIGFSEFQFRGIREDNLLTPITSFQLSGSRIAATGNATGSYPSASVPEPFTIIGTLVGGTAALRLRKKLKASNKD